MKAKLLRQIVKLNMKAQFLNLLTTPVKFSYGHLNVVPPIMCLLLAVVNCQTIFFWIQVFICLTVIACSSYELMMICLLSQSFQGGFGVEPGQYAPSVPGGQPRPTGLAPQPVPLGGGQTCKVIPWMMRKWWDCG